MRLRRVVVLVIAVLATSITGQEEPLPVVIPRSTVAVPAVALAVEPVVETAPPTLASAARANDYPTFAALYVESKDAAYAPLYELWTYAVTDPIGAFYGPEMHARYARLYPGFAAYIEEHKIVDDRGNRFYPTSETREFLLARAAEGIVAETSQRPPVPLPEPAISQPIASRRAAAPVETAAASSAPPTPVSASQEAVPAISEIAPPVVIAAPPPVVTAKASAPAPAVAVPEIIPPSTVARPAGDLTSRGLLLVIIGLLGIGLLALLLRTPGGVEQLPREP